MDAAEVMFYMAGRRFRLDAMDHQPTTSISTLTAEQAPSLTILVISTDGVRQVATPMDLRELTMAGKFFWIDVVGGDEMARTPFLRELGFENTDLAWALRFGQTGRMVISRQTVRVVTWLSVTFGSLSELHLLGSRKCVLTVWDGDASALAEIREHFAERAGELEKSPPMAVAILLQLLLGTLHNAISEIDVRIQTLRTQIRENPDSIDFPTLTERLQRLQSAWSDFDRYSSAVRTAIVGVEVLPGIDERGAAELNDYADQVADVEHRLQERSRWGADILQDYSTIIAQRQGEQIRRLTMASLIFLPITFMTGFFGMNFNWMIDALGSGVAFILFGVLLPTLSVVLTIIWFKRRGLL